MTEIDNSTSNNSGSIQDSQVIMVREDEKSVKLVAELLMGNIADVRPQFEFTSEMGFEYPGVEQVLDVKTEEAVSILESLTEQGILKKDFFDKLLRCPLCQSMNLTPSTHCPKCGSANIARGRVLEHSVCKYVGIEDDFLVKGGYICPKCKLELRSPGIDYQSLGLMRKCYECDEIFNIPLIKWRCMKCSSLSAEDNIIEVSIYSYRLDEMKRSWLEFELKPKSQLVEFLKQRGYEVVENAEMTGRSGAQYIIDMMANRDDGVVIHNVAIGVEVAGDEVGLERIRDYDDKAYDIGIHDKIMIVFPRLSKEAERFASQQGIKVIEVRDLETMMADAPSPSGEVRKEAFKFKFESKSQLVAYLERRGYQVWEEAEMKGKSGAVHHIDILATKDDGIITHNIAIGIKVGEAPIRLDNVFDFDSKTYDTGIQDKAFIAVPGLSQEAKQFAKRQRIRVFEAEVLEPTG